MKKSICLIASALGLLSCEVATIDMAPSPEMASFYQESLTLKSVAPDSVQRFADKVDAYTHSNPSAKENPMYQQIMDNIGYVVTIKVIPAGWDYTE